MYNASPEYTAAVRSDARSWRSRLRLTNGYVYGVEAVSYTTGSQAAQGITVGAVVAPTLKVTLTDMLLWSFDETTSQAIELTGREVVWELGIIPDISDFTGNNPNSDYEFIPMGTFTVEKVKKNGTRFEADCSHKLSKSDVPHITSLSYPTTAQVLAEEVCNSLGLTFTSTLSPTISIEGLPEGATKRDILGWIAALYGGFIFADRADGVSIAWYSGSGYTVTANAISTPEIAEKQTTYTAVTCTTSDDVYTYGSGLAMAFTCPFMTRARFDVLAPTLAGFSCRPCRIPYLLGDPLIEPIDIITLSYDGVSYSVPAAYITIDHKGGVQGSVETKDGSADTAGRVDPITRMVSRLIKLIKDNTDEIEQDIADAVREATEALRGGSSGYFYIIADTDGTNKETIWCDNKDPYQATHGIRINTEGIGFWVKDPDHPEYNVFTGPYAQAWTMNGTLYADFIKAGVLSGIKIICTEGQIGGWDITDRAIVSPDKQVRLDSTYDEPLTTNKYLREHRYTHKQLRQQELSHRDIRYLEHRILGKAQISASKGAETVYMRDAAITIERSGSRLSTFTSDGIELFDGVNRYAFVGREGGALRFDIVTANGIEWTVKGAAVLRYDKAQGKFTMAGDLTVGDVSAGDISAGDVDCGDVNCKDIDSTMLGVVGRYGLINVEDTIEAHGGLNIYDPEHVYLGGMRAAKIQQLNGIAISASQMDTDFIGLWKQQNAKYYGDLIAAWFRADDNIVVGKPTVFQDNVVFSDYLTNKQYNINNANDERLGWLGRSGALNNYIDIRLTNGAGIRWTAGDPVTVLLRYEANDDEFDVYRAVDMHSNDLIDANIISSSDERLKENITDSTADCLAVIRALQLIDYDWKDGGHESIGFSAQQARSVSPDLVSEHDGMLAVRETRLIRYLVGAVQELDNRLRELEKE